MTHDVAGDAAIQDEVLEGLSGAVRYRRWICELAEPYLGPAPLEVGSGNGDYAAEWASMGPAITASEAVPARVAGLRERFRDEPGVDVQALTVPSGHEADHSAVVAINVLEHIEDDVGALAGMRALVRDGGHVVVFVPAFPIAMSAFDREVGHFRRYRREELVEKFRLAGLEPRTAHYVNAPGLLAWILLMRIAGRRPGEGIALRAFEAIVPALRWLERRWSPPFGQSLFVVGRRATDGTTPSQEDDAPADAHRDDVVGAHRSAPTPRSHRRLGCLSHDGGMDADDEPGPDHGGERTGRFLPRGAPARARLRGPRRHPDHDE